MHGITGSAVQNPKTSLCNARASRKCSAESGNKLVQCTSKPEMQCRTRKQACAMQKFTGSAVQNPETSKCNAKVRLEQGGSAVLNQETCKCTAKTHRKCNAKSGNKQVQCKS